MATFAALLQTAFEADDTHYPVKCVEQANLDVLKCQLAGVVHGDFEPLMAALHADFALEIHAPAMFPWMRKARGREAGAAAILYNFSVLEDQQSHVLTVVAQGDVIDVTLQETGRLKPTQQRYDVIGIQQYHFVDGKLRMFRECVTGRTPDE